MDRIRHRLSCIAQHPSLLLYAITHPDYDSLLYRYWILEKTWMPKVLQELGQVQVRGLSWEAFCDNVLKSKVLEMERQYREASYHTALYLAVKWLNPRICVETGVSLGFSSWSILQALEALGAGGKLVSIDLPRTMYSEETRYRHAEEFRPDTEVGSVVPQELRGNWQLNLGDSKILLPKILGNVQSLDFFLHDSEHTYEHMKFEFDQAYSKLRPGGLLIADDINNNGSFPEFCKKNQLEYRVFEKTSNKSEFGIAIRT